jgi:hypothetical protein
LLLQAGCTGLPFSTPVTPDAAAKIWVEEAARWVATGEPGQIWAHTCAQERQRGTQIASVADSMAKLASADGQDDLAWLVDLLAKLRPHVDVASLSYRLVTENPAQADKAVAMVEVNGVVETTLVLTWVVPVNHAPIRMRYEEGAWKFCGVDPAVWPTGLPPGAQARTPNGR